MNGEGPAGAVFVPPRPNLGPEPLDVGGSITPWTWTVVVMGIFALALFVRRRRRTCASPQIVSQIDSRMLTNDRTMSAMSTAVRRVLAQRFGESLRAMTTEEVAADSSARESFGTEEFDRLVSFLQDADGVKFGGQEANQSAVEAWAEWVDAFVAAGASSAIRGK